MDPIKLLQYAWQIASGNWEGIFQIFVLVLALKAVHVVDKGRWSQFANMIFAAIQSGVLKFQDNTHMVIFSVLAFGSALLYHVYSKGVAPAVVKAVSEIKLGSAKK